MIKRFMNREKIRLLNSKTTDLDWYYSRPYQKLKFLIRDLLFMPFVNLVAAKRGTNTALE